MKQTIKVGMLVSYDYELIKNSLPPLYDYADKIVLAADKDNKTWSGNTIEIPEDFWQWIKKYDVQRKIEIYRDIFYVSALKPGSAETRQRNMLAEYMGKGGWHVQVDADEYFVDFKSFVEYLHTIDETRKHINSVFTEWLFLFKRLPAGYLFIKNDHAGYAPIATTTPDYCYCRNIQYPKADTYPQKIIHASYTRTEKAMLQKLNNWGHAKDFNVEGYFDYWKAINEKNYMFVHGFNPFDRNVWQDLAYLEAKDMQEVIEKLKSDKHKELLMVKKEAQEWRWSPKRLLRRALEKMAERLKV